MFAVPENLSDTPNFSDWGIFKMVQLLKQNTLSLVKFTRAHRIFCLLFRVTRGKKPKHYSNFFVCLFQNDRHLKLA